MTTTLGDRAAWYAATGKRIVFGKKTKKTQNLQADYCLEGRVANSDKPFQVVAPATEMTVFP